MIHKVCTVLDKAVGAFLPPFFSRSNGEATRSFQDLINNDQNGFNKHPHDYVLYYLADFDDNTGNFIPPPLGPEIILTGTAALIAQV